MVEKLYDLFLAQNHRKPMLAPRPRKLLAAPRHFEHLQETERGRRDELIHRLGRELAVLDQVDHVLPDGLQVELVQAHAVVVRQTGHVMEIIGLGAGREVAQAHFVDHALPQRRHDGAPFEG